MEMRDRPMRSGTGDRGRECLYSVPKDEHDVRIELLECTPETGHACSDGSHHGVGLIVRRRHWNACGYLKAVSRDLRVCSPELGLQMHAPDHEAKFQW